MTWIYPNYAPGWWPNTNPNVTPYPQPFNYPQQGWQCPCCKKVYNPTISMCFTCGQQSTTTPGTSGSAE